MPDYKYNNQATSQAIASISAGATSVILETGKWGLFPSTYPFQVLMQQYNSSWVVTAQEIASCTNRSWDTLTITRANEAVPNTPSSTTQAQVARSFDVWIWIIQVTNVTTAAVFTEVVNSVKKTWAENIDWIKTFRDNMVLETADLSLTEGFQILWQLAWTQRASIFWDSLSNLIFRTGSTPTERMRLRSTGALITGILEATGNIKNSRTQIASNSIEEWLTDSDTTELALNYFWFNWGSTRFRDTTIFNWKWSQILRVIGSTGLLKYNSTQSQFWLGKRLTSDIDGNATWQGAIGAKATTASFSSWLTLTTVPFASESFDTNTFHDNVTNNSRLTIPTGMGGVYQISVNGKVNGSVGYTQTGVQLFKNWTLLTVGWGGYDQWIPGFSMSEIENCSAWDYFEVKIQTDVNRTWDYIGFSIIKL